MSAEGPWFKQYATTRSAPKYVKVARELGVRTAEVIGCVTCLECWALVNRPDGVLDGCDDADIEIAACWEGEPGAFAAAAKKYRVLEQSDDGPELHDWMEIQGSYKEAKRKRDQRLKDRENTGASADNPEPSDDVQDSPGQSRIVPPEREKEREIEISSSLTRARDLDAVGPDDRLSAQDVIAVGMSRLSWRTPGHQTEVDIAKECPVTVVELERAIAITLEQAKSPGFAYLLGVIRNERKPAPKSRGSPKTRDRTEGGKYGHHPGSKEFVSGRHQL